ncbi:unnamed protein product [Moneuplotes crassus]|uniref:Uncharacterized protein n=1 Tax=Euplotes crassus TaxID=5936 RepID=A0AAD1Y795_EUPCR|nr:unnamed protein product [Moneuplotes crassus]
MLLYWKKVFKGIHLKAELPSLKNMFSEFFQIEGSTTRPDFFDNKLKGEETQLYPLLAIQKLCLSPSLGICSSILEGHSTHAIDSLCLTNKLLQIKDSGCIRSKISSF